MVVYLDNVSPLRTEGVTAETPPQPQKCVNVNIRGLYFAAQLYNCHDLISWPLILVSFLMRRLRVIAFWHPPRADAWMSLFVYTTFVYCSLPVYISIY